MKPRSPFQLVRKGSRNLAIALFSLIAAHAAQAATIYWDGSATDWSTVGSWSTLVGATSPDPAAIPGVSDIATFSISSINTAKTVNLNAAQSVAGLVFLGTNTNTTSLLGGSGNQVLTLGTSGITINSLAGAVTIGSATAGQNVAITLGGGQTWTNNSANAFTMANDVTNGANLLTIAGAGNTTINGAIGGGTGGLTNSGSGTLTLAGANTYTGTTTVGGGTILVTGSLNGSAGTALTFGSAGGSPQTLGNAGGLFNANEAAGATQGMGALNFLAGDGTVKNTFTSTSATLTFSNVIARTAGATANFISGGAGSSGGTSATNKISFSQIAGAAPTTGAFLDKGYFFGGADFAAYDAGGFIRALAYGSDTNAVTADTITLNKHVKLDGSWTPANQNTITLLSLNLAAGGVNWTQNASQTLTVPAIIKSGGGVVSTISAGTALATGAELVIRTDTSNDLLTISTPITGTALTKTGAGTLTLSNAANTYAGTTTVNAGTLKAGGAISFGAIANPLTVNGGLVDLNGIAQTVGILSGSGGTIANNAASGTVTFTIGQGGTSGGNFAGAIVNNTNNGNSASNGVIALTKTGAGTIALSGANTYSGLTTINGGQLNLNSPTALGTGNVTYTSGTIGSTATAPVVMTANNPWTLGADLPFAGPQSLNLGTGTVTYSANRIFNVSGGTLTVGNISGGAFLLRKDGAGTLVLAGSSNVFGNGASLAALNGGLDIRAGTLRLGGSGGLNNATTNNPLDIYGGATLDLNGYDATLQEIYFHGTAGTTTTLTTGVGTLTLTGQQCTNGGAIAGDNAAGPKIVNGNIKLGTTSSTKIGFVNPGGTLTVNANLSGGILYAGGDPNAAGQGGTNQSPVTYTGTNTQASTVVTGMFQIGVGNDGSVGSIISSPFGGAGSTLTFSGGGVSSDGTTPRTIINAVTFGSTSAGTFGSTTNTGKVTYSAGVDLGTTGHTLTVNSATQFDGVITGTGGSLTLAGVGTLILNNSGNNYTGGTNITSGTLQLATSGALQGAISFTNASSGTIDLNGKDATITGLFYGTSTAGTTNLITTGAGTLTLNGNVTGQDSGAVGNKIINGNLSLGNASRSINSSGGAPLTINALISGTGSSAALVNNSGETILSGANTFAGGTTLTGGTIRMGVASDGSVGSINSSAIGTGTLTMGAGGLSSDGTTARTILNPVVFNGAGSATNNLGNATNNGKLTFSAGMTLSANSHAVNLANDVQFDGLMTGTNGGFAVVGTGVLTITNTGNNFTGSYIGAGYTYGNNASNSGTLRWGATDVVPDGVQVSVGGGGTVDMAGFSDTVGGIAFGSGTAAATLSTGLGTLTVNGTSGGNSNITADSGGAMTKLISGNLSLGGGTRTIDNGGAGLMTISAVISNGGLTQINGVIKYAGANTYALGTNLNAGTFQIAGGNVGSVGTITSSPLGTGTLTFNGGGISSDSTAARTILNPVAFTGNATLGDTTNNGALTFSDNVALGTAVRTLTVNSTAQFDGILSGAGGGITKAGSATLTLAGNNAYTGLTTVSAGTLVLSGNNAAATGGMTLSGGVTQFNSPAAIPGTTRNVTVTSPGILVFGSSFDTNAGADIASALLGRIVATSTGVIAADNYATTAFDFNTAGLTAASLGAVGNVTYSGTLTPNGTTYRLGGGGGTLTYGAAIGSGDVNIAGNVVLSNGSNTLGALTVSSGVLDLATTSPSVGAVTLSGGTIQNGTLNTSTNTYALSGGTITAALAGSGAMTSTGTPTLNANNSGYSGAIGISSGTLRAVNAGSLGTTNTVTISSGATLALASDGASTGLGNGMLESISYGNAVALSGAGQTISVGQYTAGVGMLNAANKTLQLGALSISNNILTVTNNNGFGLEFTGATTLSAATPTFTVSGGSNAPVVQGLILSGQVTGLFGINKNGAGTLVLGNSTNDFGIVAGGSLIDVSSGLVSVTSDAALGQALNQVSLHANGAGLQLAVDGAGNGLAANTFAHQINTTTAGGVIDVPQYGTTTPGTLNIAKITTSLNGGASAGVAFTKTGNGILEISADNITGGSGTAYTGVITVSAGAVRVSHSSALGSATGNTIVSQSGAAVQLNGFNTAEPFTISGTGINYGGALQAVASTTTTLTGAVTTPDFSGGTQPAVMIGADTGATLNIQGGLTTNSLGSNSWFLFGGPGNIVVSGGAWTTNKAENQVVKIGSGTFESKVAVPHDYPLIVLAGTFKLSSAGAMSSAAATNNYLSPGATITLDNSGSGTSNRLGNSASTLTLTGGTLGFIGGNSANEAVGELRVGDAGLSPYASLGTVAVSGTGGTLSFASLTSTKNRMPGGVVNFTTSGGTPPSITFVAATTVTDGLLLGSSTSAAYFFNGTDFATSAGTANAALSAYSGYTSGDLGSLASDATKNYKLSGTQTSVNTKTANTLYLAGGLGVTINSGQTLTIDQAAMINNGGGNISGGTINTTSNRELILNWATNGSISSIIGGNTGGLTKVGAGNLTLSAVPNSAFTVTSTQNNYTGPTNVDQGTLTLSGGNNTLTINQPMAVNSGATLALGSYNQYVGSLSSAGNTPIGNNSYAVEGSGGSITGTGTLTVNQGVNYQFGGNIGAGPTALNFVKTGSSTLTLTSAQSTTGTISVIGGGLTLKDGGTLLAPTGTITLNGGTLTIDNTGTKEVVDRVKDTSAITLNGGTIIFNGRAQSNSTETLGAVTANTGASWITAVTGGTNVNSAQLTLTSLTRNPGAAIVLGAMTNLGTIGNNSRVVVSGGLSGNLAPVNGVVPGVFNTQGSDNWYFVGYVPGLGFGALGTAGFPNTVASLAVAGITDNVAGGGAVASGGQTINSLGSGAQGSVTFVGTNDLLTISSGMMLLNTNTLGSTAVRGKITSGTQELFIGHRDGNATPDPIINSVIVDKGPNPSDKVSLVVQETRRDRGYYTWLTAPNTYSGGTFVSGGVVSAGLALNATTAGTVVIPAGGLTINDLGLVDMSGFQGQIDPTNIVTLNGGGQLNLMGTNTLAGITFNSNGGTVTPTVGLYNTITAAAGGNGYASRGGTTGTLVITGDISSTPSNVAVVPLVSGGVLDLNNSSSHNITVNALTEGTYTNSATNGGTLAGLNITSTINNGGFTKLGGGILQLSAPTTAPSVYAGTTTITAGAIQATTTTALSPYSPISLANTAGVLLDLNSNANTIGSLTGGGTTGGNVAVLGTTALTLGADNTSPTAFLGNIIGNGAGTLTKIGNGTQILAGSNTITGLVTVKNGTLQIGSGTGSGSTGSLNGTTGNALTFAGTGTFNVSEASGVSQGMGGALSFTAGNGTVQSTNNGGNSFVTFSSLARSAGGTGNFIISGGTNGTSNKIVLTGQTANSFLNPAYFFGGNNFVWYDTVSYVRGINYGGDTNANAADSIATGKHVKLTTTPANQASIAFLSMNLSAGGVNYTQNTPSGTTTAVITVPGILKAGGGSLSTLSGGTGLTTASNAELVIRTDTANDLLTISTPIGGVPAYVNSAGAVTTVAGSTGGLTKTGAGTLTLSGTNLYYLGTSNTNYTGTTTIDQGTLVLSGTTTNAGMNNPLSVNTLTPNQALIVQNGGTLDIGSTSQYVASLSSAGSFEGNGGNIIGTGTLTSNPVANAAANNNNIFAGNIGSNSGALNFVKAGTNTLTLSSGQSTTGTINVIGGGLTLLDGGTLTGTPTINVKYSTLTLNNTGAKDMTDRVNNAAAINLDGGSLTFNGRSMFSSSEILGAVTLNTGESNLLVSIGTASTGGSQLTLTSLTRNAGAMLNLNRLNAASALSTDLGKVGSFPRLLVTSTPGSLGGVIPATVGGIVPGVFSGERDLVGYVDGLGFGNLGTTSFPSYTSTATLAGVASTANVFASAALAVTSGGQTLNAVNLGTNDLSFVNASDTLALTSGMLMTAQNRNVGTIAIPGVITSSTSELFMFLWRNGASTMTVNSKITGANMLVFGGDGNGGTSNLILTNSNNNYTGGTVINAGGNGSVLTLSNSGSPVVVPNATDPTKGLILNNSTATMTVSQGQIGSGNAVTLNGASTLTLFGDNTLAGLTLNGNGGTTATTVNPGTSNRLTLSGNSPVTVNPSNVVATPVIGVAATNSGLALSGATPVITVNPLTANPYAAGLTIYSSIAANNGFALNGGGVLMLTPGTAGTNNYTGMTTITSGILRPGATGALSPSSPVSLANANTALLELNGFTSTIGSLTGGGASGGNVNLGSTVLTLGGDNTSPSAYAGIILGTTIGGCITKIGTGTQILSGANTYGGTTTINGGTLQVGNGTSGNLLTGGAIFSALTFNGGAINFQEAAGSSQGMGALTFTSGPNTVTSTFNATSATVTFASLAGRGAGATGNFVTSGGTNGTPGVPGTNVINFTTSPGTGFLNQGEFFNGSDYAYYDTAVATKFLRAPAYGTDANFSVSSGGATLGINSTATHARLDTNPVTAQTSASVATLKINGTLNLTLGAGQALTFNNGGLINTGDGNSINGGYLTPSAEFVINTSGALGIGSVIGNAASNNTQALTKVGAGNLTLNNINNYTGVTTVNGGTLTLGGGNNTLVANKSLLVNSGATLDIGGNSAYVGTLTSSAANEGTGGTVTGSGGTLTFTGNGNYAGTFGGSVNLTQVNTAANTLTLYTAGSTTTGTVSVLGGTLKLTAGTTLPSVSSITIKGNSTLNIDNAGTRNSTNRVNDSAPITVDTGTITFGGGYGLDSTETLGAVTANTGLTTLNANANSGTAQLTLASLARNSGAMVNVAGATSTLGLTVNSSDTGRVILSNIDASPAGSLTNGILKGVIVNGTDVAGYVTGRGVGALGIAGFPAYSTASSLALAGTTDNYKQTVTADSVKFGGQTLNSLAIVGSMNLAFASSTDVLTLTSGMLVKSGGAASIGASAGYGALTSGTSELFLYNNANALTVNSTIQGNLQAVLAGAGSFTLTAANTHTGGTVVDTAAVSLSGPEPGMVVIPAGGLTINNATVTMNTIQGQIDPSNTVTLNGGATLALGALNNTLNGLTFNSNGGTTAPTVSGTGILTLTGNITSTPTNVAVTPTVSVSSLYLSNSVAQTITVDALPQGNYVNGGSTGILTPLIGLNISSGIQSGGFTKQGLGVLQLSGTNVNTGGITVNAGVLLAQLAVNLPTFGDLTLNAGGSFSMDNNTGNVTYTANRLQLNAGSNLTFDWNAGNVDRINSTLAANTSATAGNVGITINPVNASGTPTLIGSTNGGLTSGGNKYFLSNNTNFTATLAQSDTAVSIGTYVAATPLTSAYWAGGRVSTTNGAPVDALGAMAFSYSTFSNWDSDAGGTSAGGLVPGSGTNVIFSGASASQQSGVVLGDSMTVSTVTFNDSTPVTIAGSGSQTLRLNSAGTGAASAISTNQNATINANVLLGSNQTWTTASGKTLTVGGVVSGASSLTKAGAGTQILSAVNTYSGTTSVTGGTLVVSGSGSINSSSGITVNGSTAVFMQNSSVANSRSITLTQGTLGGTGTLTSAVTSASGVTIAPGDRTLVTPAKGTLTIQNALNLSGGTTNIRLFSTTESDRLVQSTTGTITFGGTLNLNEASNFSGTYASGNSWDLFDWAGTPTGTFSTLNLPTLSGLTWNTDNLYTTGVISIASGSGGSPAPELAITTAANTRVLANTSKTIAGTYGNSGTADLTATLTNNGGTLTVASFSPSGSQTVTAGTTNQAFTGSISNVGAAGTGKTFNVAFDSATASGTLDVVNQRTFTAGTLSLGRVLTGSSLSSVAFTTAVSTSGAHAATTDATLNSFSAGSLSGISSPSFGGTGSFTAAADTVSGTLSGTVTGTPGSISGSLSASIADELAGTSTVTGLVTVTGTAVADRAVSSIAVDLGDIGRRLAGSNLSLTGQTLSFSSTGSNSTLTDVTIGGTTYDGTTTTGTLASQSAGITGVAGSGTATISVAPANAETNFSYTPATLTSASYTATAVNQRTFTSPSNIALGRVLLSTAVPTGQSADVTSTGQSQATTADSTLAAYAGSAINGLSLGGGPTLFDGTTTSATYTLTGTLSGTAGSAVGGSFGLNATDEFSNALTNVASVSFTGTAVGARTVTAPGSTDLGTYHAGAAVSVTSNNTGGTYGGGTGVHADTEDATLSYSGTADANGINLVTGDSTLSTATGTRSFTGTAAVSSSGGSFSVGVSRELSGAASSINVDYTIAVYSGDMVWGGTTGATWGTNSNWSDATSGGAQVAPGLDAGYAGSDIATFGATSGSVTVNLGSAAPSVNQVVFNGTGSYTLAQGGSNSLTLAGGSAKISSAGTQAISAPVILANNTEVAVSSDTLSISGAISGSGSSLSKTGGGILELANASGNSYDGGTSVTGGTLLVNNTSGSGVGSGALSVGSSAKLGGSGVIGAATTIAGIHAPGNNGAGIQTFSNGLQYTATSHLEWQLNANSTSNRGTTYDGVDVSGGSFVITSGATLDLGFAGTVDFANSFWNSTRSWTVADLGSSLTGDGGSDLFTLASYASAPNYTSAQGSFSVSRVADANSKNDVVLTWQSPYDIWAAAKGLTGSNNGLEQNPDGDAYTNLIEYAFDTNPNSSASGPGPITYNSGTSTLTHGQPTVSVVKTGSTVDASAIFGRRKDYAEAGLTYTVYFSANMSAWEASVATPDILHSDATLDMVKVPYPLFLSSGKKAAFFKVEVTKN